VHVVGWSMYPTLESGDMLIASKIDYRLHTPDRGDIIILKAPLDPSRDYVKRIIGLPGDHILIRDSRVYVNGDPLAEPYLGNWQSTGNWPNPALRSEGEKVPVNSYFVLGDNRDRSNDSRVFGYVRQDQIDGKVFIRFWPLGHAELITLKPTLAKT
jgi:signal peptidase I